ncbi:hypothetical protein AMS62_07755 [Bacillus sp. FJAT-18019]|nr:hypothetical protein AMS62_07755 [Bacillus sp. FJAT-18019]
MKKTMFFSTMLSLVLATLAATAFVSPSTNSAQENKSTLEHSTTISKPSGDNDLNDPFVVDKEWNHKAMLMGKYWVSLHLVHLISN